MTNQEFLTYREAAERFATSRSKVTRAVKAGLLIPERKKKNGRDILTLRLNDLEKWAQREGLWSPPVTPTESVVDREQPRVNTTEHQWSPANTLGQPRLFAVNRK